jgi:hypothetical protein
VGLTNVRLTCYNTPTNNEGKKMSNTLDSVVLHNNFETQEEYDETLDTVGLVLENWRDLNSHKASDNLRIDGEQIGWERRSGYKEVEVETDLADAIVDALRINGDWTLVFKVSHDGTLSVVRYTHDEPTGAGFSIGFIPEEINLIG